MYKELKGLCAISVTPFKENGTIDDASLRNLVEFYLQNGVHGLVILGIMGEVHKLTESERLQVMETVLDQNQGRVPVIVGCTSNSTDVTVMLCKKAERAGADAVMVAPPFRTNNESLLFQHYAAISEAVSLPIVLQDEPVTSGVQLPVDFIVQLAGQLAAIQYVKLEEMPTTIKVSRILEKTDSLKLFGGLGGQFFFEEMKRGASGIMTGFAYPNILVQIYEMFVSGDTEQSRELFYRYLPLIRYEAQLGPGGVGIRKEIFRLRKVISSARARMPAAACDKTTIDELQDMIGYLELHDQGKKEGMS